MKRKCNIIMLACTKVSDVDYNGALQKWGPTLFENIDLSYNLEGSVPQHLYITSDDDIKVGDWHYMEELKSWGNIQAVSVFDEEDLAIYNTHSSYKDRCKKVIASTDPRLTVSVYSGSRRRKHLIYEGLPEIPASFIKGYVKNPVGEVMVDYGSSGKPTCTTCSFDGSTYTIWVSRVKDKVYSRDEVIALVRSWSAHIQCDVEDVPDYWDEWLDEKL